VPPCWLLLPACLSHLGEHGFGFAHQGRHRQLWCCRSGGLMPSLPSMALAPGPLPFCLPWAALGRAEVKLLAQLPDMGSRLGPWLIKCLFVQELPAPGNTGHISPWSCPVSRQTSPNRRGIPGPCRGPPPLPLSALLYSLGDKGI